MNNIKTQRIRFLESGYDPIPLKPKSKVPAATGWKTKPTVKQWEIAADDANIGLRAGNGRAFIDCDTGHKDSNPETTTHVISWLGGLGYHEGDYPIIQTPNLGAHVYVNFTGLMMDSKKNLTRDVGTGEFRYGQGAQVATFPSMIEEGQYTLISGNIARLPEIDLQDISQLVNINEEPQPTKKNKKMSRLAYAIASGIKPDKYQSDSEGEAALVLSLINSGFAYEEIKQVFNSMDCLGHYRNKHAAKNTAEGDRWLYMTYQEMLAYSQHESPVRRMIAHFLEQAQVAPWSNATRQKVFIEHLKVAHQIGKPEYDLSVRDLAVGARVHRDTAANQTRKLMGEGLIHLVEAGTGLHAHRYSLDAEKIGHTLRTLNVRVCPKFSEHDAFRNGGGKYAKGRLGKRAGQIYELIFNNPLTVDEIASRTGATKGTVINALNKMHKFVDYRTGEIIEMVSPDEDDTWRGNLVDLDVIAAIIGTFAATGKQRITYEKERHQFKREIRNYTRRLEVDAIKGAE